MAKEVVWTKIILETFLEESKIINDAWVQFSLLSPIC